MSWKDRDEPRYLPRGAKYPTRGTLIVRERDGKRYVGNYVRESGEWKRSSWRDIESLLAFYLEDSYVAMTKPHPFLELMRKRA